MIIYKDKAVAIIGSNNLPRIWLIFGTDEGEINLIIRKLIDKVKNDTSEVITIDSYHELQNTIQARSLFHNSKIIILSGSTDEGIDKIENSVAHLPKTDYLIIRGNDLKKSSKLRNFFESHESAVALNCYKLDSYSIIPAIESELKRHKIIFDRDIPQMIARMVAADSRVVFSEVEKIALFLANSHDRKLTSSMVEDLISLSAELSLDRLFASLILKNKKLLSHEIEQIDSNNYMLVIRAYQNFLCRLISVQQELGSIGIEGAMNKLKPPLFGRQKVDFIEVVRKSLLEDNIAQLQEMMQLECDIKTFATDQIQLLTQRLYEMVLN